MYYILNLMIITKKGTNKRRKREGACPPSSPPRTPLDTTKLLTNVNAFSAVYNTKKRPQLQFGETQTVLNDTHNVSFRT